jgi:hypothetical protein
MFNKFRRIYKNKGLSIEEIKEILYQINIILKNMEEKDINIIIKLSELDLEKRKMKTFQ